MKLADPHGYAVSPDGVVHSRYAPHARGLPRSRSLDGARRMGGDRPCPTCYPQVRRRKAKP